MSHKERALKCIMFEFGNGMNVILNFWVIKITVFISQTQTTLTGERATTTTPISLYLFWFLLKCWIYISKCAFVVPLSVVCRNIIFYRHASTLSEFFPFDPTNQRTYGKWKKIRTFDRYNNDQFNHKKFCH